MDSIATPVLRCIGQLSPFDEARATIDKWEKEYPDAIRLALIADVPDGFEYQITGDDKNPVSISEITGLFYRCAQLAAE